MPPIEQKVAAELENIDNALLLIPDDILSLSALELAGLGAVCTPSTTASKILSNRFSKRICLKSQPVHSGIGICFYSP